jgi:hypothetical protein
MFPLKLELELEIRWTLSAPGRSHISGFLLPFYPVSGFTYQNIVGPRSAQNELVS